MWGRRSIASPRRRPGMRRSPGSTLPRAETDVHFLGIRYRDPDAGGSRGPDASGVAGLGDTDDTIPASRNTAAIRKRSRLSHPPPRWGRAGVGVMMPRTDQW